MAGRRGSQVPAEAPCAAPGWLPTGRTGQALHGPTDSPRRPATPALPIGDGGCSRARLWPSPPVGRAAEPRSRSHRIALPLAAMGGEGSAASPVRLPARAAATATRSLRCPACPRMATRSLSRPAATGKGRQAAPPLGTLPPLALADWLQHMKGSTVRQSAVCFLWRGGRESSSALWGGGSRGLGGLSCPVAGWASEEVGGGGRVTRGAGCLRPGARAELGLGCYPFCVTRPPPIAPLGRPVRWLGVFVTAAATARRESWRGR